MRKAWEYIDSYEGHQDIISHAPKAQSSWEVVSLGEGGREVSYQKQELFMA